MGEFFLKDNWGEGSDKVSKQNSVDKQYCDLLIDIQENGYKKGDRTGTGTTSVFGRVFRHRMSKGFPLLTSKKMYTKGILIELFWFLGKHLTTILEEKTTKDLAFGNAVTYIDTADKQYAGLGRTNIQYLLDNNCYIWVGDAYKKYEQNWLKENPPFAAPYTDKCMTKEEFIEAIKTNDRFAELWGDLGPIYGKQWRSFGPDEMIYSTYEKFCVPENMPQDELLQRVLEGTCEVEEVSSKFGQNVGGYDQIAKLIEDLYNNPDSRRLMVTAWNPLDLEAATLPPCHYGFQCYTRELSEQEREFQQIILSEEYPEYTYVLEYDALDGYDPAFKVVPYRELSLSWNQRSVDTPLGLPFNIASYGFLLEMLAKVVNMVPGELVGYLGDTHIYNNQLEGVEQQLANPTFRLPKLKLKYRNTIESFELSDFVLENYQHAGIVNYPLSN